MSRETEELRKQIYDLKEELLGIRRLLGIVYKDYSFRIEEYEYDEYTGIVGGSPNGTLSQLKYALSDVQKKIEMMMQNNKCTFEQVPAQPAKLKIVCKKSRKTSNATSRKARTRNT